MEKLLECRDLVHAYVYEGGERKEYIFSKSPENIASFIGGHPDVDKIVLTDPLDRLILAPWVASSTIAQIRSYWGRSKRRSFYIRWDQSRSHPFTARPWKKWRTTIYRQRASEWNCREPFLCKAKR